MDMQTLITNNFWYYEYQEEPCIAEIIARYLPIGSTSSAADTNQYKNELENQLDEKEIKTYSCNTCIDGIQKWEIWTANGLKLSAISNVKLNDTKQIKMSIIANKKLIEASESYNSEMVVIGPNGTTVSRRVLNGIEWNKCGEFILSKLLLSIFGHETLASSSLLGQSKAKLDPFKVYDITFFFKRQLNMSEHKIHYLIGQMCGEESRNDCDLNFAETENIKPYTNPDILDFVKKGTSEMATIGPIGTESSRNFHGRNYWNLPRLKLSKKPRLDPLKAADTTFFLKKGLNLNDSEIQTDLPKKYCVRGFQEKDNTKIDRNLEEFSFVEDFDLGNKEGSSKFVTIGPNGTVISSDFLNRIDWYRTGSKIARGLLSEIFGNKTLAVSSHNALRYTEAKKTKLDPLKVADIVFFFKNKLNMTESDIRKTINSKCCHERKKLRRLELEEKENSKNDENTEDINLDRKNIIKMVTIGPNGTEISCNVLNNIDWDMPLAKITRIILFEIFGHKTLAFSSLAAKISMKPQLDPRKVADITFFLKTQLNVKETEIRTNISRECTNQSRLYRDYRE